MGILLMNIVSFGFPENAHANPLVAKHASQFDVWAWASMFVIVDGKMRGLFSLLFGASMLLVMQRAEAKGESAISVHRRRMWWLLLIGAVHGYLIWDGDILMLYATCGLIAAGLAGSDQESLLQWAVGLIFANWFIWGGVSLLSLAAMKSAPEAAEIALEIKAYSGSYYDALAYRFSAEEIALPLLVFISNALETIGLFALGMALLRNGFLVGTWKEQDYWRIAEIGYLIGIPPLVALAAFAWTRGFDMRVMTAIEISIAPPFRIAVMMGHVALLALIIKRFMRSGLMARIAAAGRAAFTNYLGTSILMTTLFYGYGFGLFGQLARWQAYLIVPLVWVLMLLWSKPWLDRFHYGPAEWLWRSLARGARQPMLKEPYQKRDGAA